MPVPGFVNAVACLVVLSLLPVEAVFRDTHHATGPRQLSLRFQFAWFECGLGALSMRHGMTYKRLVLSKRRSCARIPYFSAEQAQLLYLRASYTSSQRLKQTETQCIRGAAHWLDSSAAQRTARSGSATCSLYGAIACHVLEAKYIRV